MILPFSLRFKDGTPSYFVDGILKSLWHNDEIDRFIKGLEYGLPLAIFDSGQDDALWQSINPKFHTIRRDTSDRWEAGKKIHFAINVRTPQQYQFAPVVPCTGVERIEINWFAVSNRPGFRRARVKINGTRFGQYTQQPDGRKSWNPALSILARNDGFHSVDAFFDWFDEDYTGKIIHWTDLKYVV